MRTVNRQLPADPAVAYGKNILSFPRPAAKRCAGDTIRSGGLARLTAALLLRRRRREAVRRLLSLDDRMLADIGLLPEEPRGIMERWRSGRWMEAPSTSALIPDSATPPSSFVPRPSPLRQARDEVLRQAQGEGPSW